MDILKHALPIKSLIFFKLNCHAKMAPDSLIDKVPQGRWKTATFLAALRQDRIDAPCLFEGPINGERFRAYVEQFLVPTLKPGDVVILDNLGSHKGKAVRRAIRDVGARLVFLPKYALKRQADKGQSEARRCARLEYCLADRNSIGLPERRSGAPRGTRCAEAKSRQFSAWASLHGTSSSSLRRPWAAGKTPPFTRRSNTQPKASEPWAASPTVRSRWPRVYLGENPLFGGGAVGVGGSCQRRKARPLRRRWRRSPSGRG